MKHEDLKDGDTLWVKAIYSHEGDYDQAVVEFYNQDTILTFPLDEIKKRGRSKVFRNLKPSATATEYVAECGTLLDPFVTCALRWDRAKEFTDKTVEVEGYFYKGTFLVEKIKQIK